LKDTCRQAGHKMEDIHMYADKIHNAGYMHAGSSLSAGYM
jgi:hypothetical protein